MIIQIKEAFKRKVEKEMPEFTDSCHSMSVEDLKLRLVQLSKDLSVVEDQQSTDEKLLSLKEQIKEMNAPYRDAKKALKAKIRYVVDMLQE